MFRRRIFFDSDSGKIICGYVMQGVLNSRYTADMEAAALGLTNCSCMEWTEPDADIEAAFEPVDADGNPRIVNVSVDVSGTDPQLVFAYEAVPEPQPSEVDDMAAALTLLGVVPEVDNA